MSRSHYREVTEGIEWPFRIYGDYIEWFDQKKLEWEVPLGASDTAGYRMLSWRLPTGVRRFLRAHAVCWMTHRGEIPPGLEVDHIDGDKGNNLITNLRLVTHAQNILYARERLGNWSEPTLRPHQLELLLALPVGWRCLVPLAECWGVSKFYLGNIRSLAKKANDPRFLATL